MNTEVTISLDLGCGRSPRNPFNASTVYGIDLIEDPSLNLISRDLVIEKIPFPDNHLDYITAFDFIEHIPRIIYNPTRRNPFIELMDEIWRTLKFGGYFLSFTPAFPHPQAFYDPTHVNIITEHTFPLYFTKESLLARNYGFKGSFNLIEQSWKEAHLCTILQKTQITSQQRG
jgi:SAM-dependent methyltransferase